MKKSILVAGASALLLVASPALAADGTDAISYELSADFNVETALDEGLGTPSAGDHGVKLVGTADWGELTLVTGDANLAAKVEDPLEFISFERSGSALLRVKTSHFGPELTAQVANGSGVGLAVSHDVSGATVGALFKNTLGDPSSGAAGAYVTVPVPVGNEVEVSGVVATGLSSNPPNEAEPLAFGATLSGEVVSNFEVETTYTKKQVHFNEDVYGSGETNLFLEGVYTFSDLQGAVSYDHLGDAEDTDTSKDDTITTSLAYRTGDSDFDDVFDDGAYYETGSTGVKGTLNLYSGDKYGTDGDNKIEVIATSPLSDGLSGMVRVWMIGDQGGDTDIEVGTDVMQAESALGVDARLHYQVDDTVALIPTALYKSWTGVSGDAVEDFAQTDLGIEVEKKLSESTTASVSFTNEGGKYLNGDERSDNVFGLGFSVSF